jgi:GntR family transcriptional regulator
VGSPLLRIDRIASNPDDVVFEYSVTHVKGASLSLLMNTRLGASSDHWDCSISW